jgi:hypothetical protein
MIITRTPLRITVLPLKWVIVNDGSTDSRGRLPNGMPENTIGSKW